MRYCLHTNGIAKTEAIKQKGKILIIPNIDKDAKQLDLSHTGGRNGKLQKIVCQCLMKSDVHFL